MNLESYPWRFSPPQWRALLSIIAADYGPVETAIASSCAVRAEGVVTIAPTVPAYDLVTRTLETLYLSPPCTLYPC